MKVETQSPFNIFHDPSTNFVVMEWDGYATSIDFREGTELMLNHLIKNQASKVLADIKDMTLIGMEDQQWLENYFLPRATKFGLKACAIVKPDNYFNKVAIESIIGKIRPEKISVGLFDNKQEANEWLHKLNI